MRNGSIVCLFLLVFKNTSTGEDWKEFKTAATLCGSALCFESTTSMCGCLSSALPRPPKRDWTTHSIYIYLMLHSPCYYRLRSLSYIHAGGGTGFRTRSALESRAKPGTTESHLSNSLVQASKRAVVYSRKLRGGGGCVFKRHDNDGHPTWHLGFGQASINFRWHCSARNSRDY